MITFIQIHTRVHINSCNTLPTVLKHMNVTHTLTHTHTKEVFYSLCDILPVITVFPPFYFISFTSATVGNEKHLVHYVGIYFSLQHLKVTSKLSSENNHCEIMSKTHISSVLLRQAYTVAFKSANLNTKYFTGILWHILYTKLQGYSGIF